MPTPSMRSPAPTGSLRGAGWTPRLALSLLGMVLLVEAVALAYHTAATALPSITQHFQTSQAAWILTAYALSGTVTAPIFGKLADRFGKKRVLLIVLILSTCGSLIAATASTFAILIAGRALEGFICAAMFLTYSLIRDTYPAKIVPFAASITVTGAGALAIFIPTLIGVLLDNFGFRSVFFLSAGWVGAMTIVIAITTRETDVRTSSKIDTSGAFLIAAGIGSALTAISMGNTWGWTDTKTLGLLILGIAVLVVYVFTSKRKSSPILDVRMFTRRGILLAVAVAAVGYAINPVMQVMASLIGLTPPQLGGGYGLGLSATALAQITTPQTVASVVAGLVTGLIVRRVGPWNTARAGIVVTAIAVLYMAFRHQTVPDMILGFVILGIGSGFTNGSIPNLVMAAAPPKEQASLSSGVQVAISGTGAIAPILIFVVLGRTESAGPGGAVVYTDGGIFTGLLACTVYALIGLLVISTILRPRVDPNLDIDGTDDVQSALLSAEIGTPVVTDRDAAESELRVAEGAAPRSASTTSVPTVMKEK